MSKGEAAEILSKIHSGVCYAEDCSLSEQVNVLLIEELSQGKSQDSHILAQFREKRSQKSLYI